MAITRSFGGQTLLKPGAYSVSRVDNAQGIAVGENNTLMLIGESSDGVPGGTENARTFTNIQNLIDYYVSGDIVDAALAAGRPSITPGISAPTNFIIYKTNPSTSAVFQLSVKIGAGTLLNVFDAGDVIPIDITFPINASGETYTEKISITIDKDYLNGAIAGAIAFITAELQKIGNLTSVFLARDEVDGELIALVALKPGPQFGAPRTDNLGGGVVLSVGTIIRAKTTPTADGSVGAVQDTTTEAVLSALGNTDLSELNAAFTDAFNFDPNVIVPLWSNPVAGLSNPFDTSYIIDTITAPIAAAALQSHLIERSSVTVRKEAQGMVGIRNADWKDSYRNGVVTGAGAPTSGLLNVNSFLIQAMIQDIRIIDAIGALAWKGPHIMAALMAGIRLGSTVGEPLTFKFINANGVGHNINPSTGMPNAAPTQFRPGFDFNEAIFNGLTFTETASGGNRVVVDNTRYAIDESFVFNRGSVIEAAQFVARTSRDLLETIFVGNKVSNGAALSLKNVLRNYLIQLNADQIITSSDDAPFGFVEDTFVVNINGNTAEIQVEVKPVQGLDFIFIDFTLGNITQQA